MHRIKIMTGINESIQSENFQNATLQEATNRMVCSIAVYPNFPRDLKTEIDVKDFLEATLKSLSDQGWRFEIEIGPNTKSAAEIKNMLEGKAL